MGLCPWACVAPARRIAERGLSFFSLTASMELHLCRLAGDRPLIASGGRWETYADRFVAGARARGAVAVVAVCEVNSDGVQTAGWALPVDVGLHGLCCWDACVAREDSRAGG